MAAPSLNTGEALPISKKQNKHTTDGVRLQYKADQLMGWGF
jgi:hypothetical protein